MEVEYTTPRKRQHLDADALMDVDPPIRRPLHPAPSPFASLPPRGPPRPSAPSSNFTFQSSLPYEAFSMRQTASAPQNRVSAALVLAPATDPGKEELDLSSKLGATTVQEALPPATTARRRTKRDRSPKRKARERLDDGEEQRRGQLDQLAPSHHYSLHQHHYGGSLDRQSEASHWWQEEVPYVLLGYLQVGFNAALVGLALWLLFGFVSTIRADVNEKIDGYSTEIRQEILHCSAAYVANNCDPSTRVPALAAACTGWEHCMNRDPRVVGRARVGAETFAEVLDGFVNAISWKTMTFLFLASALVVTLTNSAIGNVRHRLHATPHPYPPPPYPSYPSDRPALPHWPASAPARLDPSTVPQDEQPKKGWLRFWQY